MTRHLQFCDVAQGPDSRQGKYRARIDQNIAKVMAILDTLDLPAIQASVLEKLAAHRKDLKKGIVKAEYGYTYHNEPIEIDGLPLSVDESLGQFEFFVIGTKLAFEALQQLKQTRSLCQLSHPYLPCLVPQISYQPDSPNLEDVLSDCGECSYLGDLVYGILAIDDGPRENRYNFNFDPVSIPDYGQLKKIHDLFTTDESLPSLLIDYYQSSLPLESEFTTPAPAPGTT